MIFIFPVLSFEGVNIIQIHSSFFTLSIFKSWPCARLHLLVFLFGELRFFNPDYIQIWILQRISFNQYVSFLFDLQSILADLIGPVVVPTPLFFSCFAILSIQDDQGLVSWRAVIAIYWARHPFFLFPVNIERANGKLVTKQVRRPTTIRILPISNPCSWSVPTVLFAWLNTDAALLEVFRYGISRAHNKYELA